VDEGEELHQYVIYEQAKPKGPKVIKLDDPKGKTTEMENYTPPTSLTVHLSKIDMPELKPRTTGHPPPGKNIMKEWDKKGKVREKEREKEKEKEKSAKKDKRKEDEKKQKQSTLPPDKLTKPSSSSSKPPSPGHPNPPANMWVQYPSQYNQPGYQQQSGALNTGTQPPPPPQLGSVVSNLMGRLDRLAKR